jgi:hypothetical protein
MAAFVPKISSASLTNMAYPSFQKLRILKL